MAVSLFSPTICFACCFFIVSAVATQINSTSPWTIVRPGWVPEPNCGRGTLDIVWTCLVTIFACSWTVTHPDFPGTSGDGWDSKLKICIWAVIAPEAMAYMAFSDYLEARYSTKAIQRLCRGRWTIKQTFFVKMGGVNVAYKDCTRMLGARNGIRFSDVTAFEDLQRALVLDLFKISQIPEEEVASRSKSNSITKAVICLQASWVVAQVIGRAVAKLPTTTLEVGTVGYVLCALITSISLWRKPQDADVSIEIDCKNFTEEEFFKQLGERLEDEHRLSIWSKALCMVVIGAFGAVHCIAWNFNFATHVESVMWKVASVVTMLTPMMCFEILGTWQDAIYNWIVLSLVPIYASVRLYLVVEIFVGFRSVPIGIFQNVQWSSWIPHV